MTNGFFRELKHYKLYEISNEFNIETEETKRLVGILKKYGVIKTVNASKPDYEDLSNQDIVLTDVVESSDDVEYVFDFVGVVMLDKYVFKCYPKYISSNDTTMNQLKQVLKVIKKYNEKKRQLVYLFNGEDDNRIFNRLAVSLHLLEDYFEYGLYTNQHSVIETNGEGEILWDKTINETFTLIQNNRPYYVELQTQNTVDNDMDYFRRLHECVISQCTAELKETGILELFDIAEAELTNAQLADFGDIDYIKYRLEREIQSQFITKKQTLLKTIYTYIVNEKTNQQGMSFNLYGTNSFNMVWENVCAENFGNMLELSLAELPTPVSDAYESLRSEKLINIIEKPVWWKYEDDGNVQAIPDKTLKPDLIRIYPCLKNAYCFGIFDAKYYCVNIEYDEKKGKGIVTGQMGIGDITKQYLYQLAYKDFIKAQGYQYVQNVFLCPQEEKNIKYGYVEMNMLHSVGNTELENIVLVKLCATEMYDLYLRGIVIEDIEKYLPMVFRQQIFGKSFSERMLNYLSGALQKEDVVFQRIRIENGKRMYPERIKKELGAKLLYDTIYSFVESNADSVGLSKKENSDTRTDEGVVGSYECFEQMAELALKIQSQIKDLSDEELQNEEGLQEILECGFADEESKFVFGKESILKELVARIIKLIKEVYL